MYASKNNITTISLHGTNVDTFPVKIIFFLDENALQTYAKLVYEREFGQAQNKNDLSQEKSNREDFSSLEEEKFQWTGKSTLLLIETRLAMEKDFIKPACSKKNYGKELLK